MNLALKQSENLHFYSYYGDVLAILLSLVNNLMIVMGKAELTCIWLLQVWLQQAAVQEELKPGSLKRRAGPTGGHSSDPVRRLRTHPPLVNSDEGLEISFYFKDITVTHAEGYKELGPATKHWMKDEYI